MGMMIGVSLKSEREGRADRVPRVLVADALENAIIVLEPSDSIVLKIVDCFKPECALEGEVELK